MDALNRSHFWTPSLESQAQDKVIAEGFQVRALGFGLQGASGATVRGWGGVFHEFYRYLA